MNTATTKHKVDNVVILWSENGYLQRKYCDRKWVFPTIGDANRAIQSAWYSAPKSGGYDKTKYLVTFDDGHTYEGRIDLKHPSCVNERQTIDGHMRSFLEFYSGRVTPHWITEAQVKEILSILPSDHAEQCAEMLDNYEF